MIIHIFHQMRSFYFTGFHFTSFHLTSIPFTSVHFTSLHFASLTFTWLTFTSLHYTSRPIIHFPALSDVSSPSFKNLSLFITYNYFLNFHSQYMWFRGEKSLAPLRAVGLPTGLFLSRGKYRSWRLFLVVPVLPLVFFICMQMLNGTRWG